MQFLYINPNAVTGPVRATVLGCGWMPAVPAQFTNVATAPCVILAGAGQTIVLNDTGNTQTNALVQIAAAPIIAAEAAAQTAAATLQTNHDTLTQRAQAALAANATFQALVAPTNAQTLAQVQLLTKECNALIRILIGQLDAITGT